MMSQRTRRVSRARTAAARSPRLDPLEPRLLLSAITNVVGNASYVGDGFLPTGAAYATDGSLWFLEQTDLGPYLSLAGPGNTRTPVLTIEESSGFTSLVAGPGNTLFFIDQTNNDIIRYEIGAVSPVTTYDITIPPTAFNVAGMAVSGDAVWFFTNAGPGGTDISYTNNLGHLDPDSGNVIFLEIPSTSAAGGGAIRAISAANVENNDGVFIGFSGGDFGAIYGDNTNFGVGASTVGAAYFDGAIQFQAFTFSDPGLQGSELTGIATGPDNSIWVALGPGQADPNSSRSPDLVETIINAVPNGGGSLDILGAYVVEGALPDVTLGVQSLTFDAFGDLWFVAYEAHTVGFLDTNIADTNLAGAFSISTLPPVTVDDLDNASAFPYLIVLAPPASLTPPTTQSATILTMSAGFTWLTVDADITPPPAVEFQGEAGLLFTPVEETFYSGTQLFVAMFTAPAGTYEAVINWGDGSPLQVVLATSSGDNQWVVYADKRWSNQNPVGSPFNASVQIRLVGGSNIGDPLTFSYEVTDTPLVMGGIQLESIFNRIAVIAVTFTDDVDAKSNWYNASINWGDGSTTRGIIIKDPFNPGRFYITGIHVYKKKSVPTTYNIKVTLTTSEAGATATTPLTAERLITI